MEIKYVFFTWIIIVSLAIAKSKNGNTSSYYATSSLSSTDLTTEPDSTSVSTIVTKSPSVFQSKKSTSAQRYSTVSASTTAHMTSAITTASETSTITPELSGTTSNPSSEPLINLTSTATSTSSIETMPVHGTPTSKPPCEPQTTTEKNLTTTPIVTMSLTIEHVSISPITEIERTVTMPTSTVTTTIETATSPQTTESSSTRSPSTTMKTSSTRTEMTKSKIPTSISVGESSGPASSGNVLIIVLLVGIPLFATVLLLSYGIWYLRRRRSRMLLDVEGGSISRRTMKPEIPGYNPKNVSPENFKHREKAAKLTAHVDEPLENDLTQDEGNSSKTKLSDDSDLTNIQS
uniref:Uncharacterized protein n=1 Tax=Acrobeloides nanus TaxID=290746 RepID=A0A914EII5_9BILA